MKKHVFYWLLALLMALTLTASAAVALPDGLTDIEANAFEDDTRLTGRVVLPPLVQTVGARAFAKAPKVRKLFVKSARLTSVKNCLKYNKSVKTIKVPASKVKAYKKIFTKKVAGKKVKVK